MKKTLKSRDLIVLLNFLCKKSLVVADWYQDHYHWYIDVYDDTKW